MFNRLKNLLAPPVFADEEQTRLARLLTSLLRGMIVTVVVTAPVLIALMPASERVFLLLIHAYSPRTRLRAVWRGSRP